MIEDMTPDPETHEADPAEAPETEADPQAAALGGEPSPEAQIAAVEAEKLELQDRLLRSIAEVDNIRKRAARETADARVYAVERFAGDLLSVSDNLARAMDALDADTRASLSEGGQSLMGGIEMTLKELHTVFARFGVKPVEVAPGAPFDPNLHQAVSQVPSEQPAGTVALCYQCGWKIGERVLRAAMVTVSTGPAN